MTHSNHCMPPGIEQAYYFQVFNTISWSIVQGLPILLFFKFMGASDTVLGLAAALNPLMTLLQIPAASHVERIGYRAFVLRGWSARNFFIGAITTVPALMHFLDRNTCMMLTLFFLFIYSSLRGISMCAFLPWITRLIPEKVRGTYISRDQMCSSLASLVSMLCLAALFYPEPSRLSFTIAFFASFVSGLISLLFLRKMPDVPVPHASMSTERVPWRKMILYTPFLKHMRYNLLMSCAYSIMGVFWIPVLREEFHWDGSQILFLAAGSTLTAIAILWFFGRMIDRVGSLPLLYLAGVLTICNLVFWTLATSKLLPLDFPLAVAISISGGLGASLFNLANTRLLMATVPEMGRSHFFALFSVLISLTMGASPIVWGIVLDGMRATEWHLGPLIINNYSFLYLSCILVLALSFVMLLAIREPRAMSSEEFFRELLVDTPSRAISRLLRGRSCLGQ